jgi:hypothetical protein
MFWNNEDSSFLAGMWYAVGSLSVSTDILEKLTASYLEKIATWNDSFECNEKKFCQLLYLQISCLYYFFQEEIEI